jgi:hypothetical protein
MVAMCHFFKILNYRDSAGWDSVNMVQGEVLCTTTPCCLSWIWYKLILSLLECRETFSCCGILCLSWSGLLSCSVLVLEMDLFYGADFLCESLTGLNFNLDLENCAVESVFKPC